MSYQMNDETMAMIDDYSGIISIRGLLREKNPRNILSISSYALNVFVSFCLFISPFFSRIIIILLFKTILYL